MRFALTLFVLIPLASAQPPEFVESPLQPGVWRWAGGQVAGSVLPGAAAPMTTVHAIPGFVNPGSIVRDGTKLYVGEDTPLVRVVDTSTPGAEFVATTITTPVAPIDLLVKNNTLYVIDQDRDTLWRKALPSGAWQSLALSGPNASEWDYGNILIPHPTLDKAFVIHMWENSIDVVNLATWQLEATITDLHHLPDRIQFNGAGTQMAVLCVGLSAPSCAASGPNLAVFDLATLVKQYEVNLQGDCSLELLTHFDDAYVVRNGDLKRYELVNGSFVDELPDPLNSLAFGRNGTTNGRELYLQNNTGRLLRVDFELSLLEDAIPVVTQSQVWFPPIEEMTAFAGCDGRVFVTNRNDKTVSVVQLPHGFIQYAKGCAGSAGFHPKLDATGCPTAFGHVTIQLSNGLGSAASFLFLGTGTNNLNLGSGCRFLVDPISAPILSLPLSGIGPGAGSWTIATTMPPAVPIDLVITLQAAIADPGAPLGYCMSNGVRFEFE
ncbi:MAG: hypothetical protein JNL94_18605 [Planctomycetes bacterium]|nr:hypothetical protein [Planctomycetota bacterium]